MPNKLAATAVLRLTVRAVSLLLLLSSGSSVRCGVPLQDTGRAVAVRFLGQAQGRSSGGLVACPLTEHPKLPMHMHLDGAHPDDTADYAGWTCGVAYALAFSSGGSTS